MHARHNLKMLVGALALLFCVAAAGCTEHRELTPIRYGDAELPIDLLQKIGIAGTVVWGLWWLLQEEKKKSDANLKQVQILNEQALKERDNRIALLERIITDEQARNRELTQQLIERAGDGNHG